MNCHTVEDCDEYLACIADMRLIDAASPTPEPALIDDLETSLRRMRSMYADHREPSALAHITNSCAQPRAARTQDTLLPPTAARNPDTRVELPEPEACSGEIVKPRKNIQRPAEDFVQFPGAPTGEKDGLAGLAGRSLSPPARPSGEPSLINPPLQRTETPGEHLADEGIPGHSTAMEHTSQRPASLPVASTVETAGVAGVETRSLSSPTQSRLWFDATAVAAAAAGDDGSRGAVKLAMVNSMRAAK